VGALLAGFYSAFKIKKRELLISSIVTIFPNIILQILFFWDKVHLVSSITMLILGLLNILFIVLVATIGGGIAYSIRKNKDRKEQRNKEKAEKMKDTKWMDRLISSIVLVFYLGMLIFPIIPVQASSNCASNKVDSETFVECYKPSNHYKVSSKWIYEKPKNRMPKDGVNLQGYYQQYPDLDPELIDQLFISCSQKINCNFDDELQSYYDAMLTVTDSAPGIIEVPVLIAKGMTYGIFHWNEKNSLKKAYINGVWLQTKQYGKAIGEFSKDPVGAIGRFIQSNFNFYSSYQKLKFNLVRDSVRYIVNSYKKVLQGNIKQGLSDLLSLPKWAGFLINKNYLGGTNKLTKQIKSKDTWNTIGEGAAKLFFTDQTIALFKHGDWKHGLAQGAGEATIHLLAGETLGKIISIIPKSAGFIKETTMLKNAEEAIVIKDAGQYSKLPTRILPDIKIPNSEYDIAADVSKQKEGSIQHVFDGNAKKYGNTVNVGGFHYENESKFGKVIKGTEVYSANGNGVYQVKVEVFGYPKQSNSGMSTMYPKNWTKEDVINGVNEVYQQKYLNKIQSNGRKVYQGTYKNVKIQVIVESNTKGIITHYPVWPQ
jgi:hypothetical protein